MTGDMAHKGYQLVEWETDILVNVLLMRDSGKGAPLQQQGGT